MRAVVDEQREKARWQRENHISLNLSLSLILVGWKRVRLWGWGKK